MCRATEVLIEEGLEKGRIEERNYINKLNSILLDSGRLDDLAKSTTDFDL